ncbi:hypothetical protein [Streptomyces sp. NL15-2K]|uniref:hypothetical protein n=1 Tax=Streptomyces sp. NL15-2K TaxID=376149 RepID=UPI000F58C992|nr:MULTISPECIES: hypothetical protein [Actinomycetes]WKX10405.1 hypothetical protein Q4V64_24005 [Kutzneria buriramensis]GCB48088.1 hypothetical protein SNL152K_5411 [Streptomyces sp. NL15-2K]
MIKQVSHTVTGTGPARFALAIEVAYELHAPAARAPEVAPVATTPTARRTAAARARARRRTVRG